MDLRNILVEKLRMFGVSHRRLDDKLFVCDKPPPRLGIYDEDDEALCHEVAKSTCPVPGCRFTADTLLESENHYNSSHRYSCDQCRKVLPSPHLLDLHIEETHDSYFAVASKKKPSFCCFIEECTNKFMNADERKEHCVQVHRLPKDFRFDQKPKSTKIKKFNKSKAEYLAEKERKKQFAFSNSKQKVFVEYSGRKFTKDSSSKSHTQDVNMDDAMEDLRNSLPK